MTDVARLTADPTIPRQPPTSFQEFSASKGGTAKMGIPRAARYPLGLAIVLGAVSALAWPGLNAARRGARRAEIT